MRLRRESERRGGEVRVPGSPVKKFPGAFAFPLLDFGGIITNEGGQ